MFDAIRRFFGPLRALRDDASGATGVEYAVLLALILMAVISAIGVVGGQTGMLWSDTNQNLTNHGFGS